MAEASSSHGDMPEGSTTGASFEDGAMFPIFGEGTVSTGHAHWSDPEVNLYLSFDSDVQEALMTCYAFFAETQSKDPSTEDQRVPLMTLLEAIESGKVDFRNFVSESDHPGLTERFQTAIAQSLQVPDAVFDFDKTPDEGIALSDLLTE